MNFSVLLTGLMLFVSLLISPATALSANLVSHAPATASAYILEPADGDTVTSPFIVKFGLEGMDLAPAGQEQENSGHHHLLIDQKKLPDLTASLPATEQIKHFGKAQTETELSLESGEHTLQLILGNYLHIPHDNPVISEQITIEVQ